MAYTALKPCSFGGQDFKIGDIVPRARVIPRMAKRYLMMGVIADAPDSAASSNASASAVKKSKAAARDG